MIGCIQCDIQEYLKSKYKVFTAKDSKGKEFKAGIVLDLNEFDLRKESNGKYIINQTKYKILSESYVAITRFRNEVLCLYSDESSILNMIKE